MSIDAPRLSVCLLRASEAMKGGNLRSVSWWLRMAADAVEPIDATQGHEHVNHQHSPEGVANDN